MLGILSVVALSGANLPIGFGLASSRVSPGVDRLSRGASAWTDGQTLMAVARGALASSYGLDLPARARRHEVLPAPSLALGHEAVIAEEA